MTKKYTTPFKHHNAAIWAPIALGIILSSCSPALISSVIVNGPKIVKSENARNKSAALQKTNSSDTLNTTRYFIYRSGSFVGSALSYLIYDNNAYVAVSNVRTFEEMKHVAPGEHIFSSNENPSKTIRFSFENGKTYFIQSMPATKVTDGVLRLMDEKMIRKELAKGKFFKTKFEEMGLKVEDICFK